MRRFLVLLLISTTNAFALEAVVTVLEAPMLKYKSLDAPVVQYLRKGDVIKIHPSVGNDRDYNKYAPSPEKLAALKKKLKETPEWNQDPLFRGEDDVNASVDDEFIPTLDRQGHRVYVLAEHIYVYFNDERELTQTKVRKDPTDYRLEEPLPKNYPLPTVSGYRGQFLIGLTQPYYESYNYKDDVTKKGYQSPIDANLTLMRQAPGNYQDRLFIGGTMNLRAFGNSYTFADKRTSDEKGIKFGLGPTISYDAYKGEKNRINLSGSVIVNLFNQLTITQKNAVKEDERIYRGYSLSPRIHLQYHRKQILEDVDFILGTSMEMETATSFQAKNGGSQTAWWRELGDDKFNTRATFTLGAYIGVQSAY